MKDLNANAKGKEKEQEQQSISKITGGGIKMFWSPVSLSTFKSKMGGTLKTRTKNKKNRGVSMHKQKGYVVWEGASLIDNAPIVVIATMATTNKKTGDMVQTWILRRDMSPIEAYREKKDFSICGACPHRWALKGDCYVNIGQAPLAVYKAYKRGIYADITKQANKGVYFKGKDIRLGAYGDPKAVPSEIWESMLTEKNKNTGYTHQWRTSKQGQAFTMASVDTLTEQKEAVSQGWRTFRVTYENDIQANEIICPAITRGISCKACGLCGGNVQKAKNIVVTAHGSRSKKILRASPLTAEALSGKI